MSVHVQLIFDTITASGSKAGYLVSFLDMEVESVSDNPHYNGARHRAWAEKVLRRAGYRCEECRRYGRTDKDGLPVRATVAHHIQHLDEHPELTYDLANGRALCEACHNKMHPEKGRKSGRFRGGGRTI